MFPHRRTCIAYAGAIGIAASLFVPVQARVTSMTIQTVERPTFQGRSFVGVGQYEKLTGSITGEVDPTDPKNALITDIDLAPRTPRGTVGYTTNFYILQPVASASGRHALLYEANNRGNKLVMVNFNTFGQVNDTIDNPNDPTDARDAGDGWLMRQGYTLVWSGWDGLLSPQKTDLTIALPTAQSQGGGAVTGRALEEMMSTIAGRSSGALTYPASDPSDRTTAMLTMRERYAQPPALLPEWRYADASSVELPPGKTMAQGWLYEFTYTATAPLVSGLGFAAVRDVVAFLRRGERTLASPLGTDIKTTFGVGFSQGGRFLRDFVRLGFNQTEGGGATFDGVFLDTAGANGIFLNARFAQPGETERQHTDRWYPEGRFPFAWNTTADPVSGAVDGALARCTTSNTCPKIFNEMSANEYWAKAGSLLTTDPTGTSDLVDAPGVRSYLFAGLPHGAASGLGLCAQPQNPLNGRAGKRALFAALDAWVRNGTLPPPSMVPRLADGTLASPTDRARVNFPTIPGVTYSGIATIRDARDWGPEFGRDGGVITVLPPLLIGTQSAAATQGPGIYPSYVPATDRDGNDLAGIRLPDIAVPIATLTGWGLEGPSQAVGDGCGPSGQILEFPLTAADAKAAGDPRRSIAERYPSNEAYTQAISAAALALQSQRLLLPEDVATYVGLARNSTAGTGSSTPPQPLGQ